MTQDNSGLIFHGLRYIEEQQCPVTQDYYDAVSRKQPPRPMVSRPCATVHDLPHRVGIPRLGTLAQASQPQRILPRPRTMPRILQPTALQCTAAVASYPGARIGLDWWVTTSSLRPGTGLNSGSPAYAQGRHPMPERWVVLETRSVDLHGRAFSGAIR